jgi:hypothetical protein
MLSDWDVVSVRAVALVTAMRDRFDGDSDGPPGRPADRTIRDRQCVVRIGQMMSDDFRGNDEKTEWLLSALGLLACRAAEDLSTASGEPMALWLERWLAEPYGSAAAR